MLAYMAARWHMALAHFRFVDARMLHAGGHSIGSYIVIHAYYLQVEIDISENDAEKGVDRYSFCDVGSTLS